MGGSSFTSVSYALGVLSPFVVLGLPSNGAVLAVFAFTVDMRAGNAEKHSAGSKNHACSSPKLSL